MADSSMTGAFKIDFPQELLAAAKRVPTQKSEQLRVEGWRNSWLSRLSEMIIGKD